MTSPEQPPELLISSKISELRHMKELTRVLDYLEEIANIGYENGIKSSNSGEYAKAAMFYGHIATAYDIALQRFDESSTLSNLKKNTHLSLLEAAKYWKKQEEAARREGQITYSNEGHTLQSQGRHRDAIESFEKASQIEPSSVHNWIDKGNTYFNLEEFEKAEESYKKATEIDPSNPYTWSYLGLTQERLKRYEEALNCYDIAVKLNPANTLFYTYKGTTFNTLGRYLEAEQSYKKAIEIDPKNSDALASLGAIYNDRFFDYTKAKEYFELALQQGPDSIHIKLNLAEILLILKEYEKSGSILNELRNAKYDLTFGPTVGLAIRVLTLCYLYLRGLTSQGNDASLDLFNYYKTISLESSINWSFNGLRNMITSMPINNNGLSPNEKELLLFATSFPELRTENDRKESLTKFRNLIEKKDESKSIFGRFGEFLGLPEREHTSSILPKSEEIRVVNTSNKDYLREGWYNWEIHLEAPQNVLGRIKSVKYVLHPTFNPPEHIIDDSKEGFRLSASGWGEFKVKVIITLKEKRIITKYHWLDLAGDTPFDK